MSTRAPESYGPVTPSSQPVLPVRHSDITPEDMQHPSLAALNAELLNHAQMINYLLGHSGEVTLASGLNLNGNRIRNLGSPVDSADAVSRTIGDSLYGAPVIAQALNVLGQGALVSYRQLGNRQQREYNSTFLKHLMSTVPTSNTALVTFGAVVSGTVQVTVSAGFIQHMDGSVFPVVQRTDTLPVPVAWGISSLSRSSGEVAAVTSAPNTLFPGAGFSVVNPANSSFAGQFVVDAVADDQHFSYSQPGINDSSGAGGSVSLGGVYYYELSSDQYSMEVDGPFASDTWTNRVDASGDGETIVAVVVLNSRGGDVVNSAAGATVPRAGASVPVIRRL